MRPKEFKKDGMWGRRERQKELIVRQATLKTTTEPLAVPLSSRFFMKNPSPLVHKYDPKDPPPTTKLRPCFQTLDSGFYLEDG